MSLALPDFIGTTRAGNSDWGGVKDEGGSEVDLLDDLWILAVDGIDNHERIQRDRQVRVRPHLSIQNELELNSEDSGDGAFLRLLHGHEI